MTTIVGAADGNYRFIDGIGSSTKFTSPYGIGTDGCNIDVADTASQSTRKMSLSDYTMFTDLFSGLLFDLETGRISGTPTLISSSTDYKVTAHNYFGENITTVNNDLNNNLPQAIAFPQPAVKIYSNVDFLTNATSSNASLRYYIPAVKSV